MDTILASTIIAVPGDKVIIRLLEVSPDDKHLTVETHTTKFGAERQVLPRDAAWTEYLSQINEHFR